jgi:replicative DNA helicase
MDEAAHGRTVLSAVIGGTGSSRALDYAAARLAPEHFTDRVQQTLFLLLVRYADQTGGIMSRDALGDLLRDRKPGSEQMYGEAYAALAVTMPEKHQFIHSVAQLRELAVRRGTSEALDLGKLIVRDGVRLDDGRELHGHADARAYVLEAFAEAERAGGAQDTPGGNVATEGDEVLATYAAVKELRMAGHVPGIQFGLPSLDRHLGSGLLKGEMCLVAAATTAGKSTFCVQCAWHNSVMEGKNVVVFTTEQLRTALRIKIVARHSRLPKFGLRKGLNDADIRGGRLSDDDEKILAWVLDDLKTGGYGRLEVVQLPEVATVSGMAGRYASIRRQYPVDVVIADYLQLFTPERVSRESKMREDQTGIVKSAASWCRAVDDGAGVPFISPWQVNGDGVQAMKSGGKYSLELHMSETKEAAKTPHMVLALANQEEDTSGGRDVALELQVLKNRGGPRGRRFPLTADFATSYFDDRENQMEDDYAGLGV